MAAISFQFAKISIPSGAFPIPAHALPANTSQIQLQLALRNSGDPTIWPNPATTVDAALEVSYDGGVTWIPGGAITGMAGGNITLDRQGVEMVQGGPVFTYPANPTHLRGQITVNNGPLVTSGSVVVS